MRSFSFSGWRLRYLRKRHMASFPSTRMRSRRVYPSPSTKRGKPRKRYSESATKIFRIGNSRLAYAVAGDVEIPLTEHAQFQFLRVAAEVFEKTPHGEFSQYTHEIKARTGKTRH